MSLDDDLIDPDAQRRRESPTELGDDQGPVNHFLDVHEFVEEYLVPVYTRPVDRQRADFRWCPRWYEHPEALARLDALWQAFEASSVIPGAGMSTWWTATPSQPCSR